MSSRALLSAEPGLPTSRPLSILCGIEPALASLDAAHEAVDVAGAGSVVFVSVASSREPTLDRAYLDAAVLLAHRDGGPFEVERVDGVRAVRYVLALAARHDLLVVSGSLMRRQSSPLMRAALRRARMPVLVARRLPRGDKLGDRVVLVAGRDDDGAGASAMGAAIARRAGAEVAAIVTDHRASVDAVLRAVRKAGATLVAVGGRTAPRWRSADDLAVAVAERAPCPVLVVRERESPARCQARPANSTAAPAMAYASA